MYHLEKPLPKDYPRILELNEQLVRFLSPLDMNLLNRLIEDAEVFTLIRDEQGETQAFLIALREGSSYKSPNYRWFSRHYDRFLYIDRIVVAKDRQRDGLGRLLYDVIFSHAAKTGIETLAAEIDIRPENPPSLAFHRSFGFEEVGRQVVQEGQKEVSLQICRR